jgi:hypothetical protein
MSYILVVVGVVVVVVVAAAVGSWLHAAVDKLHKNQQQHVYVIWIE